jgi:copper chaperone CopZ
MKSEKKSTGMLLTGILTAILASLCCITPVLALIAGISGAASTFSWIEPFRPYLAALTIGVLAFAWYQKLKPAKEEIECDCEEDGKSSFWQSKKFLAIVTVFALLMLAFPYYSGIFYPDNSGNRNITFSESNVINAEIDLEGMTCTSCEHSVNHALRSEEGVIEAESDYKTGVARVKYDASKIDLDKLSQDLEEKTGYTVVASKKIEKQ